MKFDTTFIALVPSILSLSADSYAPSLLVSRSSRAFVTNRIPKTTSGSSRLFSQWDEEEEEETTVLSTPSFEEAGKQIGDEDDQAAMDEMGEFDATSTYNANDIDRYREAIRKRTAALGMEKKTPEEIAEEEALKMDARAKEGETISEPTESADSMSQMLDLSQISSEAPRGADDNLPAMLYDPANDMTQEEMEEADPTGFLPIPEQIKWVLSKAQFPSLGSAFVETIILVVTVTVSAVVITQWDELMREIAFNFKMVPRPEEVASSMEGMIMPDDPVLGMGTSVSGSDMLKMLQEGTQETLKAVKDGTIKDILSGDVPQDL